jgi:hypothetical protein
MISTILKDKIMNEEQTLIYWEKWLKGKESLIRQCCEEIGNANTILIILRVVCLF